MREYSDNHDFFIQGKKNFVNIRNRYKTLIELEKEERKKIPYIKENDILTFFLLYEGKEILLNNETYEKLFTK